MRAAVVTSFDTPPTCQDFPTPTPQRTRRGARRRPRRGSASARAVAGRRLALHQRRPASPRPRHRRRRPRARWHAALLRPARHHDGCDGRADGRRPAPQHRPSRGQRRGAHRRGHEPRHVLMGRASPADRAFHPARASWSSARPATPAGWPSRSPSSSVPAASSAPAADPERLAALTDLGADATVALDGDADRRRPAPRPGRPRRGCRHRLPLGSAGGRRDGRHGHAVAPTRDSH